MKYVKYSLGILAVLVIVFFLLGLLKPEITYDCEIMVDKPLTEAWGLSQDPEKISEWLIGVQKMELVSGQHATVGSVYDVYFDNEGQQMIIRETITEIVPNESVSMVFTSDFMDMDYTLAMESIDGKTKINTYTTATGNSMISKSIMALMSGTFVTQEETNLANLKKAIENNTKNYSLN